METVAIVGVGLIGGSFGLALRKAGFQGKIVGVSSPKTIQAALAHGSIDEALPLEEAVPRADLVYLSQPIVRILETLDLIGPLLADGALVTDAGSTKAMIVNAASRAIRRGQFLGGHPMAGKEKRGVEEAEADLFAERTYVLTPSDPADLETPAARTFIDWVRRIGAVPVVLAPAQHDRIVSYTSHLPQLASTALAATLAEHIQDGEHLRVAGPGLTDSTRLALSAYEIWGDILATNASEIERALASYIAKLEKMRTHLSDERMRREFDLAAHFASRLRK
jgi:prephenate dehydrogenase